MAQIHMILFVCKLSIQVGDHGLAHLVRTVLLEHSANNAKIKGSVPVSDHSGAGLDDPCKSFPTQNMKLAC